MGCGGSVKNGNAYAADTVPAATTREPPHISTPSTPPPVAVVSAPSRGVSNSAGVPTGAAAHANPGGYRQSVERQLAVSSTSPAEAPVAAKPSQGGAARRPVGGAPPPLPALPNRSPLPVPKGVPVLDLKSFDQLDVVDETPMSTVLILRNRQTGKLSAGKRISKRSQVHASGDYLNEVEILLLLREVTGVVDVRGVCESADLFWTVTELCGGGRLEQWLERSPKSASAVTRELLEAVENLHSRRVCHLDIKPDNVLLTESGHVRLCDFVTACQLPPQCDSRKETRLLTGRCGTDGFRPPEVEQNAGAYCGFRADVFALGRTLQVAVSHLEPGWRELVRFCRQMTHADPAQRPTVKEVYVALFPGGRSIDHQQEDDDVPMEIDFASLESISCQDASLQGRAVAASAAQPPSRRGGAASGGAKSTVGAGRQSEPLVNIPKNGKVAHPPRSKSGLGQPAAQPSSHKARPTVQPLAISVPKLAAPKCGSIMCARIGACLCNDAPPGSAALLKPSQRAGATNGLRRCVTP